MDSLSFGTLLLCLYSEGSWALSPAAHVTLRAGLGQPQAVFLHVWHGWEIMGRGVQGGASASLASTVLFSSPRTGWTFCCPGICPAQASSWRNEQLSLKVISELLAVSGCLTASYRARVLVPWVLRVQTAAVQVTLSAFSCSFPACYIHCHDKYSFYFLCFQCFHYIKSLLLHCKFRVLLVQNLIYH